MFWAEELIKSNPSESKDVKIRYLMQNIIK
jgi:hypothetical protein